MRILTGVLVLLISLAMSAAGHASCNKRPGTPTDLIATPRSSHSIELSWRNTSNKSSPNDRHHMWFDIGVGGKAANDKPLSITGGAYKSNFKYGDRSTQLFDNLLPGNTYTFSIKARDEAGTQGCVSDRWSGTVSATTFTQVLERRCGFYARDAIFYVEKVKAKGGPAGPAICRKLLKGPRFTDDRNAHLQFCLFATDRKLVDSEDAARVQDAKLCAEAGKTTPPVKPPGQTATTVPTEWQAMLKAHNDFRAQHCSPPLQWDATLAAAAQTYAGTCPNGHGASNENLASAWSFDQNGDKIPALTDPDAFRNTWSCEGAFYDYGDPRICGGFKNACNEPKPECKNNNPVTGHFTQVVWKSATKLGCGRAKCPFLDSRTKQTHQGTKWVCRYDTGNTDSPAILRQNVMPTTCK